MSTLELQKAIVILSKGATVVHKKNEEEFLNLFDLNQKESHQLKKLIDSKYMLSFSQRGLKKRFSQNIKFIFKTTLKILNEDFVYEVFSSDFKSNSINKDNLNEFKDLLLSRLDKKFLMGKKILGQLMDYEWSQHYVFSGFIDEGWRPQENSLLVAESPFVVVPFQYDIAKFIDDVDSCGWEKAYAERLEKNTYFLMARYNVDDGEEFGEFEINKETFSYLSQCIAGATTGCPPDSYKDLVELGICRNSKVVR